ncbi:outer kinetochore KNL1 complex subunit KNL1 [Eudromia elegans]
MDNTYSDPLMENDNTERIRGKRLSSILKAPRSPLHDLGSGNEFTQDINVEKRRKNSRRVSFADTINCRVFQRDHKTDVAEKENSDLQCASDTRKEALLNQNEEQEPEAVPCEITGMDTLLHAPIQALVQQTEWHNAENTIQRRNRHDTTVIFSDENEMDMTAPHTAVITHGLRNNQTDTTENIPSFLTELKSEVNKEIRFFGDPSNNFCTSSEDKPDAPTGNKINFNAFLMSLKSNKKVLNPIEGPEKENIFFGPSQVAEDVTPSPAGYLYSHELETTCNVTKIFSGQDDGMEMTKCQASDVKTLFPGACEAPPEQSLCADVTKAFLDDGMDMTINHTAKLSFPFSKIENQSLNFKKDFPTTELRNNSLLRRTPKLQLLAQENPQLCTDKPMVNAEHKLDTTVLPAVGQQAQTVPVIPGPISFDTIFQCDKTVAFSTGDDMEITGNYTGIINNASTTEMGSLCSKAIEKTANTKSSLVEHSHPARDDDRGVTKNLADKIIPKVLCDDKLNLGKESGQELLSNSRATMFVMDDMEDTGTHIGALQKNSLQDRQHNQSIPLTSIDKTIIFAGKQNDMEMTVDNSIERILCQGKLNLAKQIGEETVSNGKTVIFILPEDMEITKTHTAILSGETDLQDRPSISFPADKTIVFTDSQDNMEITAPHTVTLSNDVKESKNQELSCKGTWQPSLHGALSASCREGTYSSCAKDLTGEHPAESKDKTDRAASSASLFPSEKETIRGYSNAIADSVYTVSIPEDTSDVHTPQSPIGNSVSVNDQDQRKLKSRRVSFKLSSNGVMDFSEVGDDLVSHVSLPIQQPDFLKNVPDTPSTQGNQVLKDDSSREEDLAAELAMDGSRIVPVSNNQLDENEVFSPEGEKLPEDFQINSEQTGQLSVSDIPGDEIDPALVPKLSDILNVCSKLENIRRRSAAVSVSEVTSIDHLPKLPAVSEDTFCTGKNIVEEENICLESGAAPIQANSGMALKDKYQGINVPLGIFLPKLPNRRNPSVSSAQDINVKSSGKIEAVVSEVSPDTAESPDGNNCTGQNPSLSQFIAEEFLPVFLEEMDSNESVNSEAEGDSSEMNKREIPYNERTQSEKAKASNSPKRSLEHDEKVLPQLKKLKMDESSDAEASQDLQVISAAVSKSRIEIHEDSPAKSPDCTQANTSSSLDSVKADTELTIQRSSQMESQLFTDSICEENLWEKFQSGIITVGEFFTLLQVHIPIQKPRQSHLPVNYTVGTPPTAEDLLYSQYIYRPMLRIYEEDCQVLSQMIEELKPYASVQNQLLVNVNRSLWEVMRTCSDEELKSFGAELNKMKSYFTKESKILAHNGKVTLYSKLLQSTQEQWEKLQTRKTEIDEILTEAENCLAALEGESGWEEFEAECDEKAGCESKGRKIDEELENLRAQEVELQRELSDLDTEKEQVLAEINQLQKKEKSCKELLNTYKNFNEWEISEWSDQQAVFTFLYDSIEFTVVFGSSIDGDFFGGIPCRKIVSMSFESLLDEEAAPLSSCLVQRLIFQFIESKECWQERCPTFHYLPQVLHDISLVVSRCKVLGEEIEFLEKWGGKFNLLKTDINDTKVKLLFSSSTAFAKFELTLSLSASYPSASLPFTVQTKIGNIGEEEISAVLSKVPAGYHYLRRVVSSIHQNLLQDPR